MLWFSRFCFKESIERVPSVCHHWWSDAKFYPTDSWEEWYCSAACHEGWPGPAGPNSSWEICHWGLTLCPVLQVMETPLPVKSGRWQAGWRIGSHFFKSILKQHLHAQMNIATVCLVLKMLLLSIVAMKWSLPNTLPVCEMGDKIHSPHSAHTL